MNLASECRPEGEVVERVVYYSEQPMVLLNRRQKQVPKDGGLVSLFVRGAKFVKEMLLSSRSPEKPSFDGSRRSRT
jgi:hypothetical protein